MLTVCIGYDPLETVAWHVCAHSVMRHAKRPIRLMAVSLNQLGDAYTRPYPRTEGGSTEFAISRFLTPWIAGSGVSVFMDADMLCRSDINELEEIAHDHYKDDVLVVKHDYHPKTRRKFLGQEQHPYPCKNWSSVMVFNGHRMAVKGLTPEYINKATPMELHQFQWAKSVGSLPAEWNHLVGEYKPNPKAKIVHYTLGTPCFEEYKDCEFAGEWREELEQMTYFKGKK